VLAVPCPCARNRTGLTLVPETRVVGMTCPPVAALPVARSWRSWRARRRQARLRAAVRDRGRNEPPSQSDLAAVIWRLSG
jgi:hypothetical protein